MKLLSQFSALIVFALLFFCKGKKREEVQPGIQVDKQKVIAALVAHDRNWRFEEISVEMPGSKTVADVATMTNLLLPETQAYVAPNVGFRFETLVGRLDEIISSGPFGKIPYGAKSLSETGMGITVDGTWKWDDAQQTVTIVPTSALQQIVNEMSESGWQPEIGKLDHLMFPIHKTAEEAQAAGIPERIRIIFEENDPKIGKITYGITLRAAWITKFTAGSSRERFFEVVY